MTRYCLAPGVRWHVGPTSLTLTDGKGRVRTLGYPEAAVWDLVSRGYALDKVVPMMTHIAALEEDGARRLVASSLEAWHEDGFLLRD
jgi:hypothetical protein